MPTTSVLLRHYFIKRGNFLHHSDVCPFILHLSIPCYLTLRCCLVYLPFLNSLLFQFLTLMSSVISNLPSPSLLFFTCLPPVSFLSIFLHFSITLSPLLIPLADPQREPREWVGLKRERRAVLYPARSSLTRLKRSKEKNNTREKRAFPSLSFSLSCTSLLFSFITPELFDISLLLSFSRGSDLRALNANS